MSRGGKYIGLFLALVYVFFFTSTNCFYHSHQLATSRLVHSHPFGGQGHSHASSQIFLIDIIDSSVYQESSDIVIPDILPILLSCEIDWSPVQNELSCPISSISLRAPPAKS